MWVTATTLRPQLRRNFNLPWQGGIETTLFDKYRKGWRANHSTHKLLKEHIETSERRERISMVIAKLLHLDHMDSRQKLYDDDVCDNFGVARTIIIEDMRPLVREQLIMYENGYWRPTTKLKQFVSWLRENDPDLIPLP